MCVEWDVVTVILSGRLWLLSTCLCVGVSSHSTCAIVDVPLVIVIVCVRLVLDRVISSYVSLMLCDDARCVCVIWLLVHAVNYAISSGVHFTSVPLWCVRTHATVLASVKSFATDVTLLVIMIVWDCWVLQTCLTCLCVNSGNLLIAVVNSSRGSCSLDE